MYTGSDKKVLFCGAFLMIITQKNCRTYLLVYLVRAYFTISAQGVCNFHEALLAAPRGVG